MGRWLRLHSIIAFTTLRRLATGVRQRVRPVPFSLIISIIALLLSGAQFYATYFFKWSELRAFVTEMEILSVKYEEAPVQRSVIDIDQFGWPVLRNDPVDEGKASAATIIQFKSRLVMTLVNNGNAPAALIKVFLIAFIDGAGVCSEAASPGWRDLSSYTGGWREGNTFAEPYSLEATSVAPGSIVVVRGEADGLLIVPTERMSKPQPLCLSFVALDHEGNTVTRSVQALRRSFDPEGKGWHQSSMLHGPITVVKQFGSRRD